MWNVLSQRRRQNSWQQQKDLIKSPLLYIIICITFLYSCPKIAPYDVEVGNCEGNTQKEVILRTTPPVQLRVEFTCVHTFIYIYIRKKENVSRLNYSITTELVFIDIIKSTFRWNLLFELKFHPILEKEGTKISKKHLTSIRA